MKISLMSFAHSHRRLVSTIVGVGVLCVGAVAVAAIVSGTSTTNISAHVTITQLTINKPTVSVGDVMLASIAVNDGTIVNVTAPSGWTQIARTDNDINVSLISYWKVAGASEPSTYTWSFDEQTKAVGGITPYGGVHTSNPIDQVAGNTGFGTLATTSAITTSAANEEVVALFATDVNKSFSVPSGMTEKYDLAHTGGPATAADDALQATAGTAASKSSTIAGNKSRNWVAQQIALRGAATAPSVVGSVTTYSSSTTSSTHTISATVPAIGTSQCLIVVPIADAGNNGAFSSVTWNGTAMTQIVSVVGSYNTGGMMYYLPSPNQGTHDLALTTATGGARVNATIFTLQNCAQSSPVDDTSGNISSQTGTSQSGTITTTVDNDLVISWVTLSIFGSGLTDDAGQTSVANFVGDAYPTPFAVSSVVKLNSGVQSMGYTWTTSTENDMFITSIKPAQ